MANKLFYFLVALSENLEIQHEFSRNPEGVMERYQLSPGEMAAVRSGNDRDVRTMADVGGDFGFRMHLIIYPKAKKQPRKSKKQPRKSKR